MYTPYCFADFIGEKIQRNHPKPKTREYTGVPLKNMKLKDDIDVKFSKTDEVYGKDVFKFREQPQKDEVLYNNIKNYHQAAHPDGDCDFATHGYGNR